MKKYLSLVLCVFVLTATANTAQAFDKKDLAKLKKTNQCISATDRGQPDRGQPEQGPI